ncbi:MAG: hypothetical protein JO312_23775 [Hyphomicrobiales bacterium]|nr:hypothetical protein [Hyphomicrobiales bacterium]
MMLDESDLDAAVEAGLLDPAMRAKLVAFAADRRRTASSPSAAPTAKFDPIHVLYYAGALLVMGAMGLFATSAFDKLGGWALAGIAAAYAAGFLSLGGFLWSRPGTRMPGGLCVAIAVSMAPLAIYGVQDALNLWAADKPKGYEDFYPLINGSWVYMELGAVVAAALALWRFPFPFILLIAAFALWFLSMDLAALLMHEHMPDWDSDLELRRTVSEIIGIVMIAVAWTLDLKFAALGDFGFWLHVFGAMTLWGGITAGEGDEFSKAVYCVFNIAFIAFGLFLGRRVYVVFGAIGVVIYLGHLAHDVFNDVIGFSFALSAIGLAVVFAGVYLERRRGAISAYLDARLPEFVRALRPPHARLV